MQGNLPTEHAASALAWLLGLAAGLLSSAVALANADGGTLALAAALGCACSCRARWRWLGGLMLGVCWTTWATQAQLAHRLPPCVEGDALGLTVVITSDPQRVGPGAHGTAGYRFRARVRRGAAAGCVDLAGRDLRLAWFGAPPLERGAVWRLSARLKPPWSYRNPAGFDYERWLLGQRLAGTGYVLRGVPVRPAPARPLPEFRRVLRERLAATAGGGLLYAMVAGDASLVAAQEWRVLRATGTVHLMVVSGLHVSLVVGLAGLLGAAAVRLLPPVLNWLPAPRLGALAGAAAGFGFVAFTGMGVPGVRAWCMASLALVLLVAGRRWSPARVLLAALVGVLLIEPLAVHHQGFWLSFAAVTSLLAYFAARYRRPGRLVNLVRAQGALLVGLTPVLAALAGQVPVVGAAANLVAVPVVSSLVIPPALAGMGLLPALPTVAGWGFDAAGFVLTQVMRVLAVLAELPALRAEPGPLVALVAAATAGCLLLGLPARATLLLLALWLAWLLPRPTGVPPGEFRVLALDVGQGSAIVVDTARHRLVFDAGPRFPSGFDLGTAVVVPSIAATGPRRIDALVLSHDDLDHVGGAGALRRALPVARLYASFPLAGSRPCAHAAGWSWDGVRFRFLNDGVAAGDDNNRSCVLLVDNTRRRALLPGDIAAPVEFRLLHRLTRAGERFPTDLMFAPHHGSRTSSTRALVRTLRPRWVFVSAGRGNRYGHPHPRVLGRYREVGARVCITGSSGALSWRSDRPETVLPAWRRAFWVSRRDACAARVSGRGEAARPG